MARLSTRSFVLPALVATFATSAIACSPESDEAEGLPDALVQSDESVPAEDLASLGVGADEEVVDDVADAEALLATTSDDKWSDADALPLTNDAVPFDGDVASLDDLEDYSSVDPVDFDPADIAADLAVQNLGAALGGQVNLQSSGPTPSWWGRSFACPDNAAKCECRGSPYNCQFPNVQVGRNRYLPARAVEVINKTTGKKTRAAYVDLLGRWAIKEATQIFDGTHTLRGEIHASKLAPKNSPLTSAQVTACYEAKAKGSAFVIEKMNVDYPCVKINYGLRKTMKHEGKDQTFFYAFATTGQAPGSRENRPMSGWILESAVRTPSIKKMGTSKVRPGASFAEVDYVVKSGKDYGAQCAEGAGFSPEKCLPSWAWLKIRPKSDVPTNGDMRDYLLRDGSFVNVLFQTPLVGGATADTVMVRPKELSFRRVRSTKDAPTVINIPLYDKMVPGKNPGTKVRGKRAFFYGSIAGTFGWLPAFALKTGTATPGGEKADTCAGKKAGFYCDSEGQFFQCNSKNFLVPGLCAAGTKCVTAPDGKAVMKGDAPACK